MKSFKRIRLPDRLILHCESLSLQMQVNVLKGMLLLCQGSACKLHEFGKDRSQFHEPVRHEHKEDFKPHYRVNRGTQKGVDFFLELSEMGMVTEQLVSLGNEPLDFGTFASLAFNLVEMSLIKYHSFLC